MSDEQDRQRERDEQEWQRKRDAIYDRAKRGELTGEEADAKAEKLGGPFSTCVLEKRWRQNPAECSAKFRPDLMPYWTLTMALAWILHRDLDEVREWYAPYLAKCSRWVPHEAGGWEVKPPLAPTFVLLANSLAIGRVGVNGSKASMSWSEAEEALWAMLQQKGTLFKAIGIDTTTTTGRHVKIRRREWLELKLVVQNLLGPGKGDEVRRGGGLGEGYRDVRVPSAAARSFFLVPGKKPILTVTKAEAPTPEAQSKRRGPRPDYDWPAMMAELVRLADKESLPKSQRAVGRYLAQWYRDHNGGKGPSANTVRNNFRPYLAHLPENDFTELRAILQAITGHKV